MHHRLADVENPYIESGNDAGKLRRKSRLVRTGEMYEEGVGKRSR